MHDPVAEGSCFPKTRQYVPRTEIFLQKSFLDILRVANRTCTIKFGRICVVVRHDYRFGTRSQMTLDSLTQSISTGQTFDTVTVMIYDFEATSFAAVLGLSSKNLILCSAIADQVANGKIWTITETRPAKQSCSTNNSTNQVVEKAPNGWIQDISD